MTQGKEGVNIYLTVTGTCETMPNMDTKKVKVALFLAPKVAHALKVQAVTAGYRALSDYVTTLVMKREK
jgi:hypothetical protein